MAKWKRVVECRLCGHNRCVQSPDNPRMFYCFRFDETYFIGKDGQMHGRTSGESPSHPKKGKNLDQCSFDFESPGSHYEDD